MPLQENLVKFRQLQERCHTNAMISFATRQAYGGKQQPNAPPSVVSTASSTVPGIKFSQDIARLELIHNIRKAPVSAQIKRVIDLLMETRQVLSPEQINQASYIDLKSNKAVFESLRNNLKVNYDGRCFSYKPKHAIKGKDELLTLIQKSLDGITVLDLKDAYPKVMKDLQALSDDGKIFLLSKFDSHEELAYANEQRFMNVNVDVDIKQLFQSIELPNDMLEIEKVLKKSGIKPATDPQRKVTTRTLGLSSMHKSKKNCQRKRKTKLTNTHLDWLNLS